MNQSDLFSYLAGFVTIVLAVALGDMIQSTHRLIRARRRIKWDAVPLVFAATVALSLVSEFFSLWDGFSVDTISLPRLSWMLTVPTLIALLAYSALPDGVPAEGVDLTKFYADERRGWVVIFGLAYLLDIGRSVDLISHNRAWLTEYATHVMVRLPVVATALAVIWVGRSRRWDVVGVIGLAAASIYGMAGWTISVRS